MPGLTRGQLEAGAAYRQEVSNGVPVQAPIGGLNTRESFDDVPPTDALQMDNWMPALGSVKIREGRTAFAQSALIATGPNLFLNPGFESGAANWDPTGTVAFVSTDPTPEEGSLCCKITTSGAGTDFIRQDVTVVPGTKYVIKVRVYGDGGGTAFTPYVAVSDRTNFSFIGRREAEQNSGSWQFLTYQFQAPEGCVLVRVVFSGPGDTSPEPEPNPRWAAFDDMKMFEGLDQGPVETLAVYDSAGDRHLISADSGNIYNASAGVVPTAIGTGFGTDRWDWCNFAGLLIMVNGNSSDKPQTWDGSILQNMDPALVGPDNPIGCHPFKNRMYYWDAQTQEIWYTELFAYGGTCTKFNLSQLTKLGGNIIRMETWTHDGGTGPDDHAVFIMSSGEIIVFQGSSPSSVADWALVGVYDIGEPLGERCTVKYGGDLIIMTSLDIINLSKIIGGPESMAQRSKIVGELEIVAEYIGSPFIDCIMFPKKKIAIFNVPDPGGAGSHQLVQNLVTGAWCILRDWTTYSWVVFNGDLYMGGVDGIIFKAFSGNIDHRWDGAEFFAYPIYSTLQTSWLNFGSPINKTYHAIKPYIKSPGLPGMTIVTAVDYENFAPMEFPSEIISGGTPWGSPWGSPWSRVADVNQDWQIVTGYGRVVSALIKTTTNQRTALASSLWQIEGGSAM